MKATFKLWRSDPGTQGSGGFQDYSTEISEGMVVLDAVHRIQAEQAPDLAVRWNCKAGKCGSCSAEINGRPKLMCMMPAEHARPERAGHRRADAHLPADQGPGHRRLVELPRQEEGHPEVHAAPGRRRRRHLADGAARHRPRAGIPQVHRVLPVPGRVPRAARPRQARGVHRAAAARLRGGARDATRSTPPTASRRSRTQHGIGYCNITKCCTKVCPEHIHITDNAIIPLKERVVDRFYDPIARLLRVFQ